MPQWNCSCPNCQAARQGRIPARTQSCVALADASSYWFLVNASPDLAAQIEHFPDLQPLPKSPRNTPIAGVLLTNSDLDHLLGLFSLREGNGLNIYSSSAVRATAESSLGVETVLNTFCGSCWHEATRDFAPLQTDARKTPGLLYRAIDLPGGPPLFAGGTPSAGVHSLAYQFQDVRTGGRVLVAPDVAAVTAGLLDALTSSDAVLFDGTFWSSEELAAVRPNARSSADMGHVTIQDCSLELLAGLASSKRIYIHINNTNPILAPDSPERAAVEAAGITVGWDGLEFEV